jgi:hypothetical protein
VPVHGRPGAGELEPERLAAPPNGANRTSDEGVLDILGRGLEHERIARDLDTFDSLADEDSSHHATDGLDFR